MKVERAKRSMTQQQLAKALKVTRFSIVAVETERYEPSLELALRVAKYFGKKVEDIFFLTEDDVPLS